MKKLLVSLLLLASSLGAETIATNLTTGLNSVLVGNLSLQSVVAANSSTNNITVYVIDAPSTNLTYTHAAYTVTSVSAPVNVIVTYTNFYGRTNVWTNSVVTNIVTVVPANTNSFLLLTTLAVPAGTTVTYSPVEPVSVNRGVLVTNTGAVGITAVFTRNQ